MTLPIEHFVEVKDNYGQEVRIPLETILEWLKDERERVVAHFQLNYRCMENFDGNDHECDGWLADCMDPDEIGYTPKPTYWDLENAIMNPEV